MDCDGTGNSTNASGRAGRFLGNAGSVSDRDDATTAPKQPWLYKGNLYLDVATIITQSPPVLLRQKVCAISSRAKHATEEDRPEELGSAEVDRLLAPPLSIFFP